MIAVISPIFFLAFLVIVGYVSEKTKFVSNVSGGLSKIITNITLPATVIISISDQNMRDIPVAGIFFVISIGFAVIILLLLANNYMGKITKVSKERRLIHAMLGSFGNVVFLAYPFISQLFGAQGLFYAILFSIINELLLWSLGVYLLCRDARNDHSKWNIKYLVNPNTLSFCVGILMLSFGLRFPDLIHAPLERLSGATVPLSMLFIGSILAKTKLKEAIRSVSVWSVCLLKMIIAVLADRYDADASYAAQTIFVSTLLSVLTLPLFYFVCSKLFAS